VDGRDWCPGLNLARLALDSSAAIDFAVPYCQKVAVDAAGALLCRQPRLAGGVSNCSTVEVSRVQQFVMTLPLLVMLPLIRRKVLVRGSGTELGVSGRDLQLTRSQTPVDHRGSHLQDAMSTVR
jgi:hypothetical protein